jgi:hypothetical protein
MSRDEALQTTRIDLIPTQGYPSEAADPLELVPAVAHLTDHVRTLYGMVGTLADAVNTLEARVSDLEVLRKFDRQENALLSLRVDILAAPRIDLGQFKLPAPQETGR